MRLSFGESQSLEQSGKADRRAEAFLPQGMSQKTYEMGLPLPARYGKVYLLQKNGCGTIFWCRYLFADRRKNV